MAGMAKKMLKPLVTKNSVDDGGLSALLIPIKASPLGVGVVVGGMAAVNLGKSGLALHNQASLGKVHWEGTAARMTSNYERNGALKMTSGATAAMLQAAQSGNHQLVGEMMEDTMKGQGIVGAIETYGVTPKFVAALYGMGG